MAAKSSTGCGREHLADPDQVRVDRPGIPPIALRIAVREIEPQRRRVGIDHDDAAIEIARHLFGETQQHRAMALTLQVRADADEPQSCLLVVDQVDPHSAHNLAGTREDVRHVSGLGFGGVSFVVRLVWEQRREDRVAPDGVIRAPVRRRLRRPQFMAGSHGCPKQRHRAQSRQHAADARGERAARSRLPV